ncbi:MAG: hypothetical protein BWX70_00214 [Verrucomicrobia bacterium ADurb.Bin070]|jgi:hypothetical protein|nr:MAG: hypothetical protein BWX70_00214 [Verrucomicrobia bacterium ADurb.Bin070]
MYTDHKMAVSRLAHTLFVALWPLFLLPSLAADVGFVAVMKGQEFAQTSDQIVALGEWRIWNETGEVQNEGEQEEPPYVFQALAFGTAPDSLFSGSVTVPGGEVMNLLRDVEEPESAEISAESGYHAPLDLNTARPDGDYAVMLNEGAYATVLSLTGDTYPPVPHITNFNALQAAAASSPVTVQWSDMGGTAQDFIRCQVIQLGGENDGMVVWQSGAPGSPGALDGTATQAEIPAGTLVAGTDYQGEVLFVKTVDIETSPALATAGYYKLTGFRIRTAALSDTALGSTLLLPNPQDGAHEVACDSAVAFHFSHPMSPAHISIAWTKDGGPLSTGTFSYQWTQGDTALLCKFSDVLPPDSQIGWTLNLAGFRDAAGFALSGTPTGSFRTGTDMPETPPDVGFIGLFKTHYHIQTNSSPVSDGRFEAIVDVKAHAPNRLKSATLTAAANGRSGPLYADPWNGDEYEVPGEYGSKTDLDRFYPNGDYQFALDGLDDGSQTVTLSLGTSDQYPDAPTVTNLADLQTVDPAAPQIITWDALADWNNDFGTLAPGDGLIELEILDQHGTEVVWVEGTDLVSGTQYEIPAGTLKPGRSYQATLYFVRITDLDVASYPDAVAVAAFESQTRFTLQTTGEPAAPVLDLQLFGGTARIFASGGETDQPYALEVSQNLQRWTPLDQYWDNGATYQYDDVDAQYLQTRFYRVRECYPNEEVSPRIAIQGTVWANSSHALPVAGAVVGTSLDGQTVVTDAQGRFFLVTDTPSQNGGAWYEITVSAGLATLNFGFGYWGDQPRDQVFEME